MGSVNCKRVGTWRSAILFPVANLIAGCALSPDVVTLPARSVTTLERVDVRASSVCGVFPSLDRSPLFSGITAGRALDPERTLAGFTTGFFPGKPPFACDKLFQRLAQGVFRFNVTSAPNVSANSFAVAFLDIESTAAAPVSVIDAEPWGLGFGKGSITSGTSRSSCLFAVSVVADGSGPLIGVWGAPTIPVRELEIGERRFFMPASRVSLNVSREIEQWLRGERVELGFVVAPVDSGIDAKASSSCIGLFTLQLRIFSRRI